MQPRPRLAIIPLPQVTPPFFVRTSLAAASSTIITLDFSAPSLVAALSCLTPDEASRPATSPATNILRIVHPAFAFDPIYITPVRAGSNVVSVMDLITGLYNHFWSPIPNLSAFDTMRRRDAVLSAQERCAQSGLVNDQVRHVDLLEHATAFAGLAQDVSYARTMVARGHAGIDEYQTVTWILQTSESTMGLGPYPRYR